MDGWMIGLGAVAAVAVGWYFFVMKKQGNLPFWKVVERHPLEAIMFFFAHPAWHIDDKPTGKDMAGPFRCIDPRTGRMHKLYAERDGMDESQDKFIEDSKRGFPWLRSITDHDPTFYDRFLEAFPKGR